MPGSCPSSSERSTRLRRAPPGRRQRCSWEAATSAARAVARRVSPARKQLGFLAAEKGPRDLDTAHNLSYTTCFTCRDR